MKCVYYVIAGGTFNHVSPHFALSAPAFGKVGRELVGRLPGALIRAGHEGAEVRLVLTRMAQGGWDRAQEDEELFAKVGIHDLVTNEDLEALLTHLATDPSTRCIIAAAAVCDFEPLQITPTYTDPTVFGKHIHPRLSSDREHTLTIVPSEKLLTTVRRTRKDIFLVAFKTTAGQSEQETYARGLKLLKRNSANLVLANDVVRHTNLVVTPEEFPYATSSRGEALDLLCEMIADRTKLTFVRTTMREGERANVRELYAQGKIPQNFVPVLEHLIARGGFKSFLGKTSGHFGCFVDGEPYVRVSSVRKTDHNRVLEDGMAKIFGDEDGSIIAAGARPSVGEHTQQQIYERFADKVHAIVHVHCPLTREGEQMIPTASQKPFECGSNECGFNTASNMREIEPGIYAVQLDGHGPNIAFHRDVDAACVINFVDRYVDFSKKTGGDLFSWT